MVSAPVGFMTCLLLYFITNDSFVQLILHAFRSIRRKHKRIETRVKSSISKAIQESNISEKYH